MPSNLFPLFVPPKQRPNEEASSFSQIRVLPFQPSSIPVGYVYLGPELGILPWTNQRPRAGDTVAIIGVAPNQVVVSQTRPVARDPIFTGGCTCRCPASSTGGLIFYLTKISGTTALLAVDGSTGVVRLLSRLIEIISGTGIAVDPRPPYDLYILDDRQGTQNLNVDGAITPDPTKQWLFIIKYTLSGSTYSLSASELMPGFPTENPFSNAINSLAVLDGVCWLSLSSKPATIRKFSGSGFTTLSLTLNGAPYQASLRGPVVRIVSKPAPTTSFFVIALAESDTVFEILQFNSSGEIQSKLRHVDLTHPQALLSVCNRLYAFQGNGTARADFPEGGGGGNGGGNGGGGGGGGGGEDE